MEYFKIQIAGNQFVQAYLIYIIEVLHPDYETHYYVGQTGDRDHRTARPAFRRLSGHLSDQGHSRENQLYRAIISRILGLEQPMTGKFDAEVKSQVSNFLKASTIEMHEIIHRLMTEFESKVLNKRTFKPKKELKYANLIDEIFSIAGPKG